MVGGGNRQSTTRRATITGLEWTSKVRAYWNIEYLDFTPLIRDEVYELLFVWSPLKIIGSTGDPMALCQRSKVGAKSFRPDFLTNVPAPSLDDPTTGGPQRLGRRPILLMDPAPVNVVTHPAGGKIVIPQTCQSILLKCLDRPAIGRELQSVHPR